MELQDIQRIYFIGIGGIGMSALARFFAARGVVVSGYDRTATPLCKQLEAEGMHINYVDDANAVDINTNVVVYTPAIPGNNAQLQYYTSNGYSVLKRSDMLHIISKAMDAICIAGTHGKTTVSTMIAHIWRHTQQGCNAFLGGISVNYNTNYWSSSNNVAVIEADEYDRSFLKLNPNTTVVTAMDADHLDIYGTEEEMQNSYVQFINSTEQQLLYKHGIAKQASFTVPTQYSYSLQNDAADFYAQNIVMHNGTYSFEWCKQGKVLATLKLNVGGMHNIENMIAACSIAYLYNINTNAITEAVQAYQGVVRRFQYHINTPTCVYIDDYAHHPEELTALIKSAKALFPGRKCSIAFQPHLFTRTRDFATGFAQALSLADEVVLLPIYPARELPIEGVTAQMLLSKMSLSNATILSKEGLLDFVKASRLEVFITAGAGDIDQLVSEIKNCLTIKSSSKNE
jgi:UDP-N-acetylmuramate--alanine ligase